MPVKTIHLPAETFHIPFEELAHLIADALWPETGPDDPRWDYGCSRVGLDSELERAVKNGTLPVKSPLTFGPHTYPVGNALLSAVVTVDDLRGFVAERGLSVIVGAPAQSAAEPAPVVAENARDAPETEWHLMATADELCAAFGTFTGMNKDWFTNLKDRPALKAARFQPGQGGRNKVEPLFYVYPVLIWLIDKRRKTGKPMQEATGWRMLRQHFPRVYEANELSAPDPD